MTSRGTISHWFDEGVEGNYDRMIVVCDTFDWSDYPVHVNDSLFWAEYYSHNGQNMQKIMEVYDLRADKDPQMRERRAWHVPDKPGGHKIERILEQAQPSSMWAKFIGKVMADISSATINPEPVAHNGQWWWSVAGEPVREMSGAEVLECIRSEALPTKAILVLAGSYDHARFCMRGINPHRWQYISEREVPPPIMHPTVIKCPYVVYSSRFLTEIDNLLERREAVYVHLTEADIHS